MSEAVPSPPPAEAIKASLLECAELLRRTDHLEPAAQKALADLIIELVGALDPSVSSETTAHLAESSADLARALHERHDEGLIAAARARLEAAAVRAEAEAPVATGLARRLIDALAGIGV
jgi:hypothetical protein